MSQLMRKCDMVKCLMCDNEVVGKAKTCSAACRKKASRQNEKTPHGHWFGKEPHIPIWTDCLRDDCAQGDNPKPDWEPTCQKPCCTTIKVVS